MRRSPLLAIAGALVAATTAFAGPAKSPAAWASGQIEGYDASASSVVLKQGSHEMTFVLAQDAQVTVGSKAMLGAAVSWTSAGRALIAASRRHARPKS